MLRNVPPHSVEAEQAVLGGVFLKPESLDVIVDMLSDEDFYLPAHKVIFEAFRDLSLKDAPVDLVSVAEQLKSRSQLEMAGGAAYLVDLTRSIVSAANAEYYAALVRDKAMARQLIHSCADIIAQGYEPGQDVRALLDESEQAIFAISQRNSGKSYRDAGELTLKVFENLHARQNNREFVTGVATDYTKLDQMTAGLQPSDLIILAARPSMGKTAFALNIAMRAAIRHEVPVAIFSLEMSMDQLIMRMLCAWGRVDVSRLRRNYLDDNDWQGLLDAAEVFRKAPIYIDDSPALSPIELRARMRRLKREKNVGLVVIDYLQLMRASRRTDSREQEISDISRNLKAMAKELNIPVIALSQLNRKVEERADKRPMLSDLRESGAIEQDADVIMFIYREAAYMKHDERPAVDKAEIIIGKQRNGPVGTVELTYVPAYTAFENLDAAYGPGADL
ncbi:replicative DNA helicase [Desulfovibrio cuneatus]|uniref:replicative DNA helicase n=1 Tax=Desulfovibrio cuneatus TaxID=159728 RepID=UPI000424EC49|nr:replicative DNA helicase [Desulfovibrio cuneatus]